MLKFLSSMRFALWMLLAFITCLLSGVLLASNDQFRSGIKAMNNELIVNWVMSVGTENPIALAWLLALCLLGAMLALSFIFCTITRLIPFFRKKRDSKSALLLIIHVLFILIMGVHVLSMLIGEKHSNVELLQGDGFEFGSGYRIELGTINYVDKREVLKLGYKQMRKYHTKDLFHPDENTVQIELWHDNKKIMNDTLRMLEPLRYKNIQVSLSYFFAPKRLAKDEIGAKLVISISYFTKLFFTLYALEIISLLIYVARTWHVVVEKKKG